MGLLIVLVQSSNLLVSPKSCKAVAKDSRVVRRPLYEVVFIIWRVRRVSGIVAIFCRNRTCRIRISSLMVGQPPIRWKTSSLVMWCLRTCLMLSPSSFRRCLVWKASSFVKWGSLMAQVSHPKSRMFTTVQIYNNLRLWMEIPLPVRNLMPVAKPPFAFWIRWSISKSSVIADVR